MKNIHTNVRMEYLYGLGRAILDLGIGQCFISRGKVTEIKTEEEKK